MKNILFLTDYLLVILGEEKNIKSKGMALDIPYLIKKVLFVILLALDTTKMEAKY